MPLPLNQRHPPSTQGGLLLSDQGIADGAASRHLSDAAKCDAHMAAKAVAGMVLTDAVDEETTMCLREQLIHSRCTEARCAIAVTTSSASCALNDGCAELQQHANNLVS